MQNTGNTSGDGDGTDNKHNRSPQPWLRWIIIGGLLVVIALAVVSYVHPYMEERFKFWATSAVNALILTAILVQAYIYTRQWEAMRDSLKETRRIVAQNERSMIAAEESVGVAREAFYLGEAPYFGATKIVFRWVYAVKNAGTGPVQTETGQPELIITFMNGGKTPAWHFLCTPHLELRERVGAEGKWVTLDAVHDRECPDSENSFYPSGAEKCIKYRGRGEFSPSEIEAIKARTQTLVLIIDLGYTDMRDDRQTRNWIRCLNPQTERFGDCGARQS